MTESNKLSFADKFTRIQTELKAPKNLYNSFGKYKYRNVESIQEALKPLLKEYGLYTTLSDEVVEIGGRIYIKAIATITDGNDNIAVSAYAREAETKKGMDDAQVTGATSSYARKYALNGLFLLDDTDDMDSDSYPKETKKKTATAEKKSEPVKVPEPVKAPAVLICERCGNPIQAIGNHTSADVAEQTRAKFGKQMCFSCGKAVKAAQDAPIESFVSDEKVDASLPFPLPED